MIAITTWLALGAQAQVEITQRQAVEWARDSAATARIAGSRSTESEQRAREAGAHALPSLEFSAGHMVRSYNFLTGGMAFPEMAPRVPWYSMQDVRLSVEAPLLAPAAWTGALAAREGARARRADQVSVGEDAALRGALAWVELSRAQALEKDREEALSLAGDLERMALDQKSSGTATGLDVLRARSQLVASQRALAAATYACRKASLALARELGREGSDSLRAAGVLPMSPVADPSASDPEPARVKAARAGREAAAADVRGARARFLPAVALAADYGWSGDHGWSENEKLAKDGEWTGQVGIFLKWSVWDGGGDDARLAQARERERQSCIGLAEVRRQSRIEREDAARLLSSTREQLILAARLSVLADSQLVLARERFAEGASGNLEVVQAQGERNAAHAAWIEAAGAHQAAQARRRWADGDWNGI